MEAAVDPLVGAGVPAGFGGAVGEAAGGVHPIARTEPHSRAKPN